jgi:hypothetical protein
LLAEDQLQVVYLHSCVLAEYLLTAEFTSLQTISRDLNLDPSDIPLLLVGLYGTESPYKLVFSIQYFFGFTDQFPKDVQFHV